MYGCMAKDSSIHVENHAVVVGHVGQPTRSQQGLPPLSLSLTHTHKDTQTHAFEASVTTTSTKEVEQGGLHGQEWKIRLFERAYIYPLSY